MTGLARARRSGAVAHLGPPTDLHGGVSPALADLIVEKAREWTATLAAGTPPDLDNTISCYETVRRLHPDIERGLGPRSHPTSRPDT
ncbi:hypothetical protein GS580_27650 [Rhodococcus hoagii]|nr:hypothetical protein [Prescottella equi]